MSQKKFNVPPVGDVMVSKRKGAKNLRLTISPAGQIRVSIPVWAPYSYGLAFLKTKTDWIKSQQQKHQPIILSNGSRVGKSYRLHISISSDALAIRSKISDNQIQISVPSQAPPAAVERRAQIACETALRKEAGSLLQTRLDQLALQHSYQYKSLKIKKLTSRWGSCSSDRTITLSYYLMQLPWQLIDYVILHELTHTNHLNHGPDFWRELQTKLPQAKLLRKQIHQFKPYVKVVFD